VGDAEHPRSLRLVVQHDALHVPLLGTKWAPKALSQQLYVPPDQAQGLVRKTRLQNGPENAVFGAISVGRIGIWKTVVLQSRHPKSQDIMTSSTPSETDIFVNKLLDKMGVDFDPELVPVHLESYAKQHDCFLNVEEKVRRDGGRIHYGWAIHKTDILCEAERHAVWEDENEELIEITPQEIPIENILFVSDNEGFEYFGQLIDNIRVNITKNSVVDDFICVSEALHKIDSYGTRVDYSSITLPEPAIELRNEYQALQVALQQFIYTGGTPQKSCICGRSKIYKNCHGKTLRQHVEADLRRLKSSLR
jgi:hypothetical protein